jgi:anti-sigma B factor antagonist
MTIQERCVGDVTILRLGGRLVLYEGEMDLRERIEALISGGCRKILIDLQDVTYMDSAGVGAMVGTYLRARGEGGEVKLLHLTSRSIKVMTITRLMSVFQAFEVEEEALKSFAAASL